MSLHYSNSEVRPDTSFAHSGPQKIPVDLGASLFMAYEYSAHFQSSKALPSTHSKTPCQLPIWPSRLGQVKTTAPYPPIPTLSGHFGDPQWFILLFSIPLSITSPPSRYSSSLCLLIICTCGMYIILRLSKSLFVRGL